MYTTTFLATPANADDDLEKHEGRIAHALDMDRVCRILDFGKRSVIPDTTHGKPGSQNRTVWNGYQWENMDQTAVRGAKKKRILPTAPLRVLDAPNLKDDFYCSPLAYSVSSKTLAVCLGSLLYAWSEDDGVYMIHGAHLGAWLTSVAFSSEQGAKAILGIGQSDGSLILKSVYDESPRFEVQQPFPIACLSWRPTCTLRPSRNPLNPGVPVQTEDLLVGDEMGTIFYYIVEWPMNWEVSRDTWPGSVTLIAEISVHCQQICGLSWAPNGKQFASGGNDNLCCLFEVDRILEKARHSLNRTEAFANESGGVTSSGVESMSAKGPRPREDEQTTTDGLMGGNSAERKEEWDSSESVCYLGRGTERHRWVHGAAVKAIAFCPWRRGLVATGGGSNDKCIHFFHTDSGAALATISVSAQVTSLMWSTTRREIVATFGYAQPEHPYRIAIFRWPDCEQVAAIPWEGKLRALYAVPYPRGPGCPSGRKDGQASHEGCIIVASSDESVKFHEVWSPEGGATVATPGILAGSDILERLEGIDKEGPVIR